MLLRQFAPGVRSFPDMRCVMRSDRRPDIRCCVPGCGFSGRTKQCPPGFPGRRRDGGFALRLPMPRKGEKDMPSRAMTVEPALQPGDGDRHAQFPHRPAGRSVRRTAGAGFASGDADAPSPPGGRPVPPPARPLRKVSELAVSFERRGLDGAFAHAGDVDTACSLVMTANAPAGGAPPVRAPRSEQ